MTNNYLRYPIIALLFIVPLVAFIVSNSLFFPYITGKNLAFRLIIEVAFFLYLVLALKWMEYRPRLNTVSMAFGAFILVILTADIFGIYPFKSFLSNFERMEGFVTHLHLFAYFIMLSAMFTGEKIWTRTFQTMLAISVIMGLIAFDPDKATSGRFYSQLGNASYLGAYMMFHIFIAGLLLVRVIERGGDKAMKWTIGGLYGLVILFDFYILYKTGTRGALLGLLAGAIFTSTAFAIWEKNRGLKTLGISVIVSILIAISLLSSFKESSFISNNATLSRFAALASFDKAEIANFATTQGKSRFGIWHIAYEGFKERPILGWGQDNFNYVFNEYYDPKIYDQEQWFDRAHNVFFDWLIAGGILGLLAYLALFVVAIIAIWRSKFHERDLYFMFSDKVILTALLIAYFIHNLFVFDNITSYILFFGLLAFISIHDRRVLNPGFMTKRIHNHNLLIAGNVVLIIVGSASIYYFVLAPYLSGKNLIKALTYIEIGNSRRSDQAYMAALDSFDKVLSYDKTTGISEAREQILQSSQKIMSNQNVSDEVKTAYFNKVNEQLNKQLQETPDDARYQLFYGLFLSRVGRATGSDQMVTEGINRLLRAVELSPRKQSILFETGFAYLNQNKPQEAVVYLKRAFEAEQSYDEARFLYVLSLIYAGNNALADEILKPLSDTAYVGDSRLVRAYYDTKQTKKVDSTILAKIAYAKKLASEGDVDTAIAEITEVISMSAPFKTEGEKLIAEFEAMR